MNTIMPKNLKPYFYHELKMYQQLMEANDYHRAFYYLERAHIIGQPYPFEHSLAHWKMLKFGFAIKSRKEIQGQLLRLFVGGIKSFIGTIPEGNTGGSNVHPLKVMAIPSELAELIRVNNK